MKTVYIDDNGDLVLVRKGLGEVHIVCRGEHGRRRVKSSLLPPTKTEEECQANLDAYAAKRKWVAWKPGTIICGGGN